MDRKEFLEKGFRSLGMLSVSSLFSLCHQAEMEVADDNAECVLTVSETAGPFPTQSPGDKVISDIRSNREGTPLTIRLTIQNKRTNCAPFKDAVIDIWHCDADGNYSQYGGGGTQAADYRQYSFLRGRQSVDDGGNVAFGSIYPGWYSGRAPHIHVHIYDTAGKSLLVTQIAFPETVSSDVYAQGVYAKRGKADTTNAADHVFRDGFSTEMATVTGNVKDGYELKHTIVIKA